MDAIATLVAKEEIRELAQLYARGVDRGDFALLRDLYTADATDSHGHFFDGPAEGYIASLEQSLPHTAASNHFICNHLVSIDGDEGDGEVYAVSWAVIPDGRGGQQHDVRGVRYIDRYRRENEVWRFAKRVVTFDFKLRLPAEDHGARPDPEKDASYAELLSRLFARGARA